MAQHDYIISNGTGAAVRSDLNGALGATVSNNSGATEPATMYAYQWWPDTTSGLLKQRNSANNAWITIGTLASANLGLLSLAGGTMTGVLAAAAGTAALPGIAFTGDLDSGVFSSGANAVDITTGGTRRLGISSAGDLTAFGGNLTLNTQGDLRFADSDSSHYVGFQAPATVTSSLTWTLPNADAAISGYALVSNASGTLSWAAAGGGATGGSTDKVFFENDQTVTTSYTLTANKNAVTAGPVTINSSVTVTVPSGASWVVV